MGVADGFGKKSSIASQFINLPEIDRHLDLNTAKHICGADKADVIFDMVKEGNLVRLETFTGPHYMNGDELCYNLYWRILCADCGKEFKQIDVTFKINEVGLSGPNTLRWK